MSDVAAAAAQPASQATPPGLTLWSHGGGFSFKDLLDIVNPLQHLPVVGSIYRYLTGDEPSGADRIVGDALYGGPIGFGVSVVTTALFTDSNGKDLGERLLAGVFGPRDASPTLGTPAVAAAQPAPTVAASQPQSLLALPDQPVAMNQLFRSPPPAAPATPQQNFLAQTAQFQRQLTNGRGTNGAVLNNRPVPLELSSNLLPMLPPGAHLASPAASPAAASPAPASGQASATPPGNPPTAANPIAQKMLDALNKYELLKKQEEQRDSAGSAGSPAVDLAL
ncbi:MAG TPA: hypothetical protein VGL83_11950 [Stellaceae bacterium]